MTLTKEHVLKQLKRVYRYQVANQTRSVIRRSGATRFIKDTDWERGVSGLVSLPHGWQLMIRNT